MHIRKAQKEPKIYIIQVAKGRKVQFNLGRFVPSQMYHLVKMGNWGQWELTDIYKQKLNEFYDEALKNIQN